MSKKGVFFISVFLAFFGGLAVYGLDTVRVSLSGVTSTGDTAYLNQSTLMLGNASLIDEGNDGLFNNDYFIGDYYDDAYGIFSFDLLGSDGVKISNQSVATCNDNSTHIGYKLEGYSWNPNFGAVNFSQDPNNFFTYICLPLDVNGSETSYLGGYAYSEFIGVQNFNGIEFDAFVDRDSEHSTDGRYVRIDGISSSQNYVSVDSQFESEVRVVGNLTKASLRKEILQDVYASINNISGDSTPYFVTSSSLSQDTWDNGGGGIMLQNGSVLYFGDISAGVVEVNGTDNIQGVKTLVVEGGDIYITQNIRNSDSADDILGLIAISKNNQGGNIFIHPRVTDIHASMYADRSVMSYDGTVLDGATPDQDLRNQLYVYGSIFSENTLGGADASPPQCPYFENSTCDVITAKKYDFNYLRRYILVSEVELDPVSGEMVPNGVRTPSYNGAESYLGDNSNTNTEAQKPGYRRYPFIIEYNPGLQTNPPPFF